MDLAGLRDNATVADVAGGESHIKYRHLVVGNIHRRRLTDVNFSTMLGPSS